MIFKLAEAPEKLRRLDGHNQLPKARLGVKSTDGTEVVRSQIAAAWSLPSPRFCDGYFSGAGNKCYGLGARPRSARIYV